MGNNVPCFSAMTEKQLFAWAWKYRNATPTQAATILIGRQKGYVVNVQELARLAGLYANEKKLRRLNRHKEADIISKEAEDLYYSLPDFARPT